MNEWMNKWIGMNDRGKEGWKEVWMNRLIDGREWLDGWKFGHRVVCCCCCKLKTLIAERWQPSPQCTRTTEEEDKSEKETGRERERERERDREFRRERERGGGSGKLGMRLNWWGLDCAAHAISIPASSSNCDTWDLPKTKARASRAVSVFW
jgi:hypothetical protein